MGTKKGKRVSAVEMADEVSRAVQRSPIRQGGSRWQRRMVGVGAEWFPDGYGAFLDVWLSLRDQPWEGLACKGWVGQPR